MPRYEANKVRVLHRAVARGGDLQAQAAPGLLGSDTGGRYDIRRAGVTPIGRHPPHAARLGGTPHEGSGRDRRVRGSDRLAEHLPAEGYQLLQQGAGRLLV